MENKKLPGQYNYSNDGYQDHVLAIHNSWTWARLTDNEKKAIDSILANGKTMEPDDETYSYDLAWDLAGDIYTNCLTLVKYQPFHWREDIDGNPIKDEEYKTISLSDIKILKEIKEKLNRIKL